MAVLAAMTALTGLSGAIGGNTSPSVYVSLDTDGSAIWRTVFTTPVTLNWKRPPTATTAVLTVTSLSKMASITGLTGESYELELPAASSAKEENVYRLVLDFDDGNSATGCIGVVTSAATGASATAPVKSASDGEWGRFRRSAVALVPCGTTALTLDGTPVDTHLGGAKGWYAFGKYRADRDIEAVLSDAGGDTVVDLYAVGFGTTVNLR